MARYGPPDDFHSQPTQYGGYPAGGRPPAGAPPSRPAGPQSGPPPQAPPGPDSPNPSVQFASAEGYDQEKPEAEPKPWYRNPVTLTGWALLVMILIALIVYGIIELISDRQGTGNPSTTTPSTTTSTTTAETATTTPPTTTTTTVAPATTPRVQPPPQQ
ncbi:hypothetical protein OSH30_19455, partial [Mycobacterium ulcerans]